MVPETERYKMIVKEIMHAIAITLTFERCPPCLIVEMVYNCVLGLNSFSHHDGVHAKLSPMTIMMGKD